MRTRAAKFKMNKHKSISMKFSNSINSQIVVFFFFLQILFYRTKYIKYNKKLTKWLNKLRGQIYNQRVINKNLSPNKIVK